MISIVVPVYNAEKFISDTIRTVLDQTVIAHLELDWELILVDDCSTDQSVAAAKSCVNELPEEEKRKIRIIQKTQNEGTAKARNTGIAAARGRYLAFLDADDLWMPEKLERELQFMKREEAAFVFTSYAFGDENGRPTGKAVRVPRMLDYQHALTRTVIFTSTVLIDLEKIPKERVYMPSIESEDTATWWNILRTGVVAYGLDELLVIYRRPAGSLSSNKARAVRRIWRLYREVAGIGPVRSAACLAQWSVRAAWRRMVPDREHRV